MATVERFPQRLLSRKTTQISLSYLILDGDSGSKQNINCCFAISLMLPEKVRTTKLLMHNIIYTYTVYNASHI